MTIWKYTIEVTGRPQNLNIPDGGRILTVQTQRGELCLWVLVDPNRSVVPRKFVVFGTGHDIPNNFNVGFIGTVQTANGAFVWHVFELL